MACLGYFHINAPKLFTAEPYEAITAANPNHAVGCGNYIHGFPAVKASFQTVMVKNYLGQLSLQQRSNQGNKKQTGLNHRAKVRFHN